MGIDDFDSLVKVSPLLFEAIKNISEKRLGKEKNIDSWRREVTRHVDSISLSILRKV
ncbi:hypothetical protein KJ693_06340 [bacterium]|nr:hypothetical protein [bacterium]MBU1614918.1 hypothetical protein [bacterium]